MIRIVSMLAAGLLLAGCGTLNSVTELSNRPVTANEIATAKDVSATLQASYGTGLALATAWARLPRCKQNEQPPFCSTAQGILAIERGRLATRTALDRLDDAIKDVKTSSSTMTALISAAQNAYGGYKDVVVSYNGGR